MVFLNVFSVVLSGVGLGFGAFTLRHAKPLTLWGVRVDSAKVRKRLYKLGSAVVVFSLAVLLFGVLFIWKVWAGMSFLYAALCACLWVLSLIIGSVCADFALAKHRDFSEVSLLLLGELEAVKTAEQMLRKAYAAVIGFEGIAFLDKEGKVNDVLFFCDFGLEELKQVTQTDILCQYFKSAVPDKEVFGLSNNLWAVCGSLEN